MILVRKVLILVGKSLLGLFGVTVITGLIVYLLVFHGPLSYLKEIYVTSAMTTMSHQYLAKWLVSDSEINEIMQENEVPPPPENTDEAAVQINNGVQAQKPEIERLEIKGKSYKGYLIKIANPERVSLVASSRLGKAGMKTEDLARENEAVAAINAGGFADTDGHGNGGTPLGILMSNGQILYKDNSAKYGIIGFDKNNILVLGNYTMAQIRQMQVRDAISFGPCLVVNGKGLIKKGNGGWGIAPRTAIGQTADGTVLFLVIDGRQIGSIGASLKDVQDIMLENGAVNAANLDGGSSSTMYFAGKIINKPSGSNGARLIPNAFIVKKAAPPVKTAFKVPQWKLD